MEATSGSIEGGVGTDGWVVGRGQCGCDRSLFCAIAYSASSIGTPGCSARKKPFVRLNPSPSGVRCSARRFIYLIFPEARGLTALDCGLLSPTGLYPRGGGAGTEAEGAPYSGLNLPFSRLYRVAAALAHGGGASALSGLRRVLAGLDYLAEEVDGTGREGDR